MNQVTFGSLKVGDEFKFSHDGLFCVKIEPENEKDNAKVFKHPKDETFYVGDDSLVIHIDKGDL